MSREHKEYIIKTKRKKYMVKLTQILILISFFTLWEVAANLRWIDPFIFSQPTRMFSTLMEMIKAKTLFTHIGITLGETIIGFLLSTIAGTLISILLWWNKFCERVLNPYLVILNSLPKTALAPIIIVWIGNNINSVIVTAVMTSIIVTILSVLTGFLEVDKNKIKLIYTLGGTKSQVLKKVVLPASIPTIISALKINVGLSFVGVMVGEFLVAQKGLGYLIMYGSQIFKMDWVLLSILILCLLAGIMYQLIVILEKKIISNFK